MIDPIQIIVLIVIGLFSFFSFFRFHERRKGILENGIEVEGVVFDFSVEDGLTASSDDSLTNKLSYPMIRFVTKEGLWITEKGDWTSTSLKQGDKVNVIYNASDPKKFIYKTSFDWHGVLSYLLLVAGIACMVIGFWFAYQYLTTDS
jgi:hypothetical protein